MKLSVRSVRLASLLGAAALTAAACGQAPTEGGGGGATASPTNPAAADFQACMVTDAGGVDDRSFNASAAKGLRDAQEQLGTREPKIVESSTDADYAPNISQLVQDDCGIIVTVGFLLGDATAAAAKANPEEKFAIVDFAYETPIANVEPLVFDTAQAAYLAGYVAAGMSESGTVATFGGVNIPTVTIFMDGFAQGIAAHNEAKGTNVRLLGYDPANPQAGSFTGDFENQDNGRRLTQTFIQQGADIILPVAGPVGLGAAAAAQASGGRANLIWVDTDGVVSAPQFRSLFLTSIVKGIDVAVLEATRQAIEDRFTGGEAFVGTLANDGVSIAPFHDFEDRVPAELKSEVDALRQRIVSGELVVQSPFAGAATPSPSPTG